MYFSLPPAKHNFWKGYMLHLKESLNGGANVAPLLHCSPGPWPAQQANSIVLSDLLPLFSHLACSDHTVSHLWAPTHA